MALDTTKTAHELIISGRSTGQTVIDSDGKLKWALHNIVPTDLDNASSWILSNLLSSVETGVNANGKKNYLLTEDTFASTTHHLRRFTSVIVGETYTIAAVVKPSGRNVAIAVGTALGLEEWSFDLDTLDVVRQSGTNTTSTATATALTNGEVLIEYTTTAASTGSVYVDFRLLDGVERSYTGDGTSGLYVSEVKVYQSAIKGRAQLITNGTFASDVSGWSSDNGLLTWNAAGYADFDRNSEPFGNHLYQSISTIIGKTYKVAYEILAVSNAVDLSITGQISVVKVASTGQKFHTFVATSSTTVIQFNATESFTATFSIDNISVLEMTDAMQRDKFGSNFLENETGAALYGLGIDYSTGRGGLQVYETRTNLVSYFEVSEANWVIDGTGLRTDQSLNVLGTFKGCLVQSQGNTFDGVRNSGSFSVTSGLDYAVSFMWSDSDSNSIGFRVFEAAVGVSVANVTTAGVLTQTDVTKGTIALGSHVEILPGLYRTTVIWTPNFTNLGLIAAGPNSATIGDSILLYCGSIEEGSSASPIIPTYGSTVTRGADDLSTLVSSFGYNVNAGTIVADFVTPGTDGADFPRVWQLATSVDNTTRVALTAVTNYVANVVEDDVQQTAMVLGAVVPNAQVKIAASFATDDFAASQDGDAVVATVSGNLPTTFTQLLYGKAFFADHLNGLIYSLAYYPFAASDAQLVEASS